MPFLPFGILNQGTAGVVRGCQICCMTLVGYLSGFCGRTFDALSGRKNIPIITVPQNLLAVTTVGPSLPVQGRCDFWDHFFFFFASFELGPCVPEQGLICAERLRTSHQAYLCQKQVSFFRQCFPDAILVCCMQQLFFFSDKQLCENTHKYPLD